MHPENSSPGYGLKYRRIISIKICYFGINFFVKYFNSGPRKQWLQMYTKTLAQNCRFHSSVRVYRYHVLFSLWHTILCTVI